MGDYCGKSSDQEQNDVCSRIDFLVYRVFAKRVYNANLQCVRSWQTKPFTKHQYTFFMRSIHRCLYARYISQYIYLCLIIMELFGGVCYKMFNDVSHIIYILQKPSYTKYKMHELSKRKRRYIMIQFPYTINICTYTITSQRIDTCLSIQHHQPFRLMVDHRINMCVSCK